MQKIIKIVVLAIGLSFCCNQLVQAHAGEHHSSSCFFSIGETKMRLTGYYVDSQFVGKHFCRIFPNNGQIVLAVDVLADGLENAQVGLSLFKLTDWSAWPGQFFSLIKQQPVKQANAGLLALQQTIEQANIYALDISLQDALGQQQTERLYLVAGVPVTKILIYFAGVMLMIIIGFWLKTTAIKR